MARKPTTTDTPDPEISQADPTRPRPTDENGRQLDEFGLPISGPARVRALDGRPDPKLADRESEGDEPLTPPSGPPSNDTPPGGKIEEQ